MAQVMHRGQEVYEREHRTHNRNDRKDEKVRNRDEVYRKEKYGGLNIGASFFGWLVANSIAVLTIAILSAIGSAVAITVTNDTSGITNNSTEIGITAGILLLITLALSYFAGGYVSGRMSRYDGAKQGLGVWMVGIIITMIIALVGAVIGSNYNILQQLNLPSIPIDGQRFTSGGLITLLAILVVTILAAIAGGKTGENYHHKVNSVTTGMQDTDE
jgi:amino acid transporter